ncbi:uncharacterized protein SCHCODRAFT_02616444 [Schizophyllum commune H4-8]|nr:uncharacterized protein SCHCODRAFT_02616444 [Schizophyllum commune H4-8]KAI5897008.1 hypothetical protein SCHCODRAFT_02616444 [Schizophyllum commune H4-8]
MSDQRRSPSLQSVNSTDSFGSLGSIDSAASPVRKTRPFNHDSDSMLASAEISAHGIGSKAHEMPSSTDTSHNRDAPCEYSSGCFSPSPAPTRKHPRFYLDSKTFEIKLDDGTLYRVLRQSFETHSTAFAAQYLGSFVEDEPIALSGVLAEDLDRFLSLIYPSELATCELSTADEWLSVLRLARKWSFPTLRTRAIREVHLTGSAVDKIAAAREFADIEELQGWLLPAFKEACSAPRWLRLASLQDAERLGAGTILAIARIREEARDAEGTYDVERAIVVAGLAPDPTPVKRTRTATQADVLRHMFSGRPANLTDVTVGEASLSASVREPLTLVSTAPASSPRMPQHHDDVSWPPPMAFRDRQSTRRGAPGLSAESVSFSNPATGSRVHVDNKPDKRTAPPPAAEAPPATMREAWPPSSFEAWLNPSAGASLLRSAAPRSLDTSQAMVVSLEEAEMFSPPVGSAFLSHSDEPPASLSTPVLNATREPSPHPLSKGQKKKLHKKMRMKEKVEADMDRAHAKGAAAKEARSQEEDERQREEKEQSLAEDAQTQIKNGPRLNTDEIMDAGSSESHTGHGASQKCEPVLVSTPVTGHGASGGAVFSTS